MAGGRSTTRSKGATITAVYADASPLVKLIVLEATTPAPSLDRATYDLAPDPRLLIPGS